MFRAVPGCSGGVPGMFRGVPGCSGVFRDVPGFTDTRFFVRDFLKQNCHHSGAGLGAPKLSKFKI